MARKGQFKKGGGRVGAKWRRSRGGRSVARRRNPGMRLPVALIAGLAPGLLASVKGIQQAAATGQPERAAAVPVALYTGFDINSGRWSSAPLRVGLFPLIIGMLVHKFVGGQLGLNRALGSAGVPFVRI